MNTKSLMLGSIAAIMLISGVITNLAGPAFAMSEKQGTSGQQMTKIDTSKLTQATKSAFKHITASKPYKKMSDKLPNTSSTVTYGNFAKSTFSKSSNHEVSLHKRSGHQQ